MISALARDLLIIDQFCKIHVRESLIDWKVNLLKFGFFAKIKTGNIIDIPTFGSKSAENKWNSLFKSSKWLSVDSLK